MSTMTMAADYAEMFGGKCDWTWAAGDGAGSRLAPNGARYWLFGDTILGHPGVEPAFGADRTMVSNTIMVQRGRELGPATWGNGTAAVPDQGNERYWTTDIMFDPIGGSAFVLCQRVHGGPEGFVTDGAQIAEFYTDGGSDRLEFAAMHPTPTILGELELDEIQWSCGWEVFGDYLYVYGYRQAGAAEGYLTPHRTYVARVPWDGLGYYSSWQFWNGSTWTIRKDDSAPILDGMLTSVRRIGGRWVFAHKPWNGYGDTVFTFTADQPQGPFKLAAVIPSPGGTSPGGHPYWTYNPTLHDVGLASGKPLLAISHNGRFADIFAERTLYRPEWMEVDVP